MTAPLPVHGADVSHHQGDLDLGAAKKAGLQFLYHKATEGNGFRDVEYPRRRVAAKVAGIPFGAYHFARADLGDAEAEATFFVSVAKPKPGDLLPCLDLETTEGLTTVQIKTWAQTFAATVRRLAGCRIVLYCPWDLGLDVIRWVPRYNRDNRLPAIPWDIWQFSGGADFPGTPSTFPGLGAVDLNTLRNGFTVDRILIPKAVEPKPPKPEPTTEPLSYVTHNIYAGNPAPVRNTQAMLKATGRPHLAAVQEANRLGDVNGYQRLAADPADFPGVEVREVLSTQILVRDDVTVLRHTARAVPGGAWSWNGNARDPRIFHRAVVEHSGVVSEFWAVHRCPGGPAPGIVGNRDAWDAESMFLFKWVGAKVEKFPGRQIVLAGDWNTSEGKMPAHPHSIERLAERLGAGIHLRGIDGFLDIGPAPKRKVVKLADKFGSDGHRPVTMGAR